MTQIVSLGDVAKIKGGKRLPKGNVLQEVKNSHPYLRIVDMGEKFIRKTGLQYVPDNVFPKISRYITNTDDVLLSIVGTIGLVAIVDEELDNASLTENCVKLTCNPEKLDSSFLYYFLTSSAGQDEIRAGRVGSTQPKLPLYNIAKIKIPDLSLDDQKKIADTLGAIDEKIELNRKMNDTLEQMGQALFRHYFIDNPVAEKWEAGTVDHLFTLTMGLSPKGESYNDTGDGVLLLNGAADFTGASITPKRYTSSPTRISQPGDIIFCIRGTIGNVCIGYEAYCLGRGVAAMTPVNHAVSYVYFSTIRAVAEMESSASGSVIRGLSKDDIAKRKVNLPPADVLKIFEANALPLIKKVRVNSEEIQTLITLRDTLLPRLINGKVKV